MICNVCGERKPAGCAKIKAMIFKLFLGFLDVSAFFARQAFAEAGNAGVPGGDISANPTVPGGDISAHPTVPDGETINLPNPLGGCSKSPAEGGGLLCVAGNIIDALFKISIPIVAIMVLVGGFQIMTAGGNAEKISSGRKTILYAAVGFVIVLLAESVVSIIQSVIGGGS